MQFIISVIIRMHRTDIIAMYKFYAQNIKAIYAAAGKTPDVIFLVEPDLYQYSVLGSNQRGLLNGVISINQFDARADWVSAVGSMTRLIDLQGHVLLG